MNLLHLATLLPLSQDAQSSVPASLAAFDSLLPSEHLHRALHDPDYWEAAVVENILRRDQPWRAVKGELIQARIRRMGPVNLDDLWKGIAVQDDGEADDEGEDDKDKYNEDENEDKCNENECYNQNLINSNHKYDYINYNHNDNRYEIDELIHDTNFFAQFFRNPTSPLDLPTLRQDSYLKLGRLKAAGVSDAKILRAAKSGDALELVALLRRRVEVTGGEVWAMPAGVVRTLVEGGHWVALKSLRQVLPEVAQVLSVIDSAE